MKTNSSRWIFYNPWLPNSEPILSTSLAEAKQKARLWLGSKDPKGNKVRRILIFETKLVCEINLGRANAEEPQPTNEPAEEPQPIGTEG